MTQSAPILPSGNLCADPAFRAISPLILGFSLLGFVFLSSLAMKVIWFSPLAADLHRLLGQGVALFGLLVQVALYLTPIIICFVVGKIQQPMAALGLSGVTAGKGLLIGAGVAAVFLLKNYLAPPMSITSDTVIIVLIPGIIVGTLFYEMFYRGFLLPALGVRFGLWPALIMVAVLTVITQSINYLFIPHADPLTFSRHLIETFVLSLIFGYLRCWTNSLWASILPHWANGLGVFSRIF